MPATAADIGRILDSPEMAKLVRDIEALRWTGRKGYPVRSLLGACLVKHAYGIACWSRVAALVSDHSALQQALQAAPSVYALYRFKDKLFKSDKHRSAFQNAIGAIQERLKKELPSYGKEAAIDSSDLPAYANGQKRLSKGGPLRMRYSDPDAAWGHRSATSTVGKGGGFYGYKIHVMVCAKTELPLTWTVEPGSAADLPNFEPLVRAARARGFTPSKISADKSYDAEAAHVLGRVLRFVPIIPLKNTPRVKQGDHLDHVCGHGVWEFVSIDYKRKEAKWRCPTGKCRPTVRWEQATRLRPLIPRDSDRWKALYRDRGAVERLFGRLKHDGSLVPLRVRGLERVRLHADLAMFTHLACRLDRARAAPVPLAA